ncbi:MAG: transcription antitermination factor NusB [Hyphomicrobiales bacterium]
MRRARTLPQPEVPGLAARRIAADIIDGVLRRRVSLDEQLSGKNAHPGLVTLADRDRALMRRLVATVLRRLGTLRHLLGGFLERGFPREAPRIESVLLIGAAQILWLDVPDHAAVDLSVRLAQADRRGAHFVGLVNAVLRRVAENGAAKLADIDAAKLDTPNWLMKRWRHNFGNAQARAIAQANGLEPALDLSVKQDAESWAARLRGRVLPTGTVRTQAHGAITMLPGFSEGAWWVQDAAAALPVHLFGDVRGLRVADVCAAPGGKTAQLALAGARVTAIDRSAQRLVRLKENLARLALEAETVAADVTEWQPPENFDAVLLDAPCSSTGTIRRHPDVPWLKAETEIAVLTSLQQRLLDRAVELTKPGGTIVYCVCSLEPEEGENQITALLARDPRVERKRLSSGDVFDRGEFITPAGDLRTLPSHLPDADAPWGGLDGFYAARLMRK